MLISNVNKNVLEEGRGLAGPTTRTSVYPIVYLDALVVKMREEGAVHSLAGYASNEITMENSKNVLGSWTSANEEAKH